MVQNYCKYILYSLVLVSAGAFAQDDQVLSNYKLKYPNASQVSIDHTNVLEISLKGDEVILTETTYREKIYLNATAKYQAKESLVYSGFFNIKDVKASAFNIVGDKYKEFKVTEFKEKDEIESSNFYDDKKSINFYYQGLDAGSKTTLSYKTEIMNPRFIGGYVFGDYHPMENYDLKIIVDNAIELGIIELYMDTAEVNFTKTTKGKKTTYHWSKKNIKSYPNTPGGVNYRYHLPHIIPHVKYYHNKGDTTNVLNSLDDLYAWYYSLIKDINSEPCDKGIVEVVDSLTKDAKSDLEKVKNIYYWTQQNIKYVAFEDGLGGFVPREANDVYKKKYGDCKDNSSLLYSMLKQAGLEGHLTWIGSRKLPYNYNQVFTPIVDNHMILTYFDGDKPYFLDATGRFTNINLPTSFIQGKEALVSFGENYKVIEVPEVDNTVNRIDEFVEINIDKDFTVNGVGTITFYGYEKIHMFDRLERIKTKDRLDDFYKSMLEKGNNNFLLKNYEENNKFDYEAAFDVHFEFTIKNYVSNSNDKLFINLNLSQDDVEAIYTAPPIKTTSDYSHKYTGDYKVKLNIPEGYEVEFIPKDMKEVSELCDIIITYKQEGNSIHYEHKVSTNFLLLTKEQQRKVNASIKKARRSFKEVVVLKQKQ